MSTENLTLLRDGLVERILSESTLSTLPVLSEKKKDLIGEIMQSLGTKIGRAGKIGSCIVVMSPVANDEMPNNYSGPLSPELAIRVLCDPLFNDSEKGTKLDPLTTAKRLYLLLKNFRIGGVCQNLVPLKPCIVPVNDPFAPLAYEIRFATVEDDPAVYVRVSAPAITSVVSAPNATVTITGGSVMLGGEIVAADSIYYVTGETAYPRAGASGAVLYSAPFVVAAGTVIRAAAYKAGAFPSDVVRAVAS